MENKIPVIDITKCTVCNKCINICKEKVIMKTDNQSCAKCIKYCIMMKVPCKPDNYSFNYLLCTACGDCVSICPEQAIYWFYPDLPINIK